MDWLVVFKDGNNKYYGTSPSEYNETARILAQQIKEGKPYDERTLQRVLQYEGYYSKDQLVRKYC